jgi:hypothetical protein
VERHVEVDGRRYDVTPDRWQGVRDHSWGIRPIGEPEAAGIRAKHAAQGFGLFHVWMPIQVPDGLVKLFDEEDQHGHRTIEESVRIPSLESGGEPREMGSPSFRDRYQSGTREIEAVTVELDDAEGKRLTVEATPLRTPDLAAGSGDIPQSDWTRGGYQDELVVQGLEYDLSKPEERAKYAPLYETLARHGMRSAMACSRISASGPTIRMDSRTRGPGRPDLGLAAESSSRLAGMTISGL